MLPRTHLVSVQHHANFSFKQTGRKVGYIHKRRRKLPHFIEIRKRRSHLHLPNKIAALCLSLQ